jgi:hypothetical protein
MDGRTGHVLKKKKGNFRIACFSLFTEVQFFQNRTVSFNIDFPKIIKEPSALSNQSEKGTLRRKVLLAYFKVLGEVINPECKKGNLTLRSSGIGFRLTE